MARWLVLAALAGCGTEFGVDPVDDAEPPARVAVEESFAQAPLPATDLLLVVDDTGSMAEEQAALAGAFADLVARLDALGVRWQLGVVSTDMEAEDAGMLRGRPYVLTPGTDAVSERFAEAVAVGTESVAAEAGLAAALRAIELSSSGLPNVGFRRPDATLHLLFVSDADDASDAVLGDDPVGAFLDGLADGATAHALVGPVPDGCSSESGTAVAAPRYHEVVRATGGMLASICDVDLAPLLDAVGTAAVEWQTVFPLRATPAPGTLGVRVDDAEATGWAFDDIAVAVVFDEPPPPSARITVRYVVVGE